MSADQVVLSRATTVSRGGGYPSMMGLLPPKLTTKHELIPQWFSNPCVKLSPGFVLCDPQAVYLFQSPKARRALNWSFAQETAEFDQDHLIEDVVVRGLAEELGLQPKDFEIWPNELFRLVNPIPTKRTGGVPTTKVIPYFAILLRSTKVRLNLNPKEVCAKWRLTGDEYLDVGFRANPQKSDGMVGALAATLQEGIIDAHAFFMPPGTGRGRVNH